MKFLRRTFMHLAAGAAALPALGMISTCSTPGPTVVALLTDYLGGRADRVSDYDPTKLLGKKRVHG